MTPGEVNVRPQTLALHNVGHKRANKNTCVYLNKINSIPCNLFPISLTNLRK